MRFFVLFFLLCFCQSAHADVFYLTIGSYQRIGPSHAHSWAVIERIGPTGLRERRCISFMPATEFRLLSGPVPGRNWSERETVEHAAKIGAKVTYFGPYPVDAAFYLRFLKRLGELESGKVLYQALDGQGARPGVMNCISAASFAALDYRLVTGLAYGERASRRIAREYERK